MPGQTTKEKNIPTPAPKSPWPRDTPVVAEKIIVKRINAVQIPREKTPAPNHTPSLLTEFPFILMCLTYE